MPKKDLADKPQNMEHNCDNWQNVTFYGSLTVPSSDYPSFADRWRVMGSVEQLMGVVGMRATERSPAKGVGRARAPGGHTHVLHRCRHEMVAGQRSDVQAGGEEDRERNAPAGVRAVLAFRCRSSKVPRVCQGARVVVRQNGCNLGRTLYRRGRGRFTPETAPFVVVKLLKIHITQCTINGAIPCLGCDKSLIGSFQKNDRDRKIRPGGRWDIFEVTYEVTFFGPLLGPLSGPRSRLGPQNWCPPPYPGQRARFLESSVADLSKNERIGGETPWGFPYSPSASTPSPAGGEHPRCSRCEHRAHRRAAAAPPFGTHGRAGELWRLSTARPPHTPLGDRASTSYLSIWLRRESVWGGGTREDNLRMLVQGCLGGIG
eukprot:gene22746-biopygen4262